MGNDATGTARVGQIMGGKYRIERPLGEGGMGQVLLATHLDLHESCAVKVLHHRALRYPDAYERFVAEARVARRLKSQHAVKVYDFGRLESGEPYIVMELLEGIDLKGVLVERGALSVAEACLYVIQACEALGEAHTLGIIHRDIKPGNIFLTKGVHGRPCIKVLDFGIAKVTARAGQQPEREMTGNAMIGTLAYMSPEQMRSSRSVDHRADIWSLGVVLFRLLTDKLPFEFEDDVELLAEVLHGTPLELSTAGPQFPAGLCAAVARCLEKDPARRYPSALELADALSPFAVHEPHPSKARAPQWEHTVETATQRIPSVQASDGSTRSSSSAAGTAPPVPTVRAALSVPDTQTGAPWSRTGRRPAERWSRAPWIAGGIMLVLGASLAVWRFTRGSGSPASVASEEAAAATSAAPDTASSPPEGHGSAEPTDIDAPVGADVRPALVQPTGSPLSTTTRGPIVSRPAAPKVPPATTGGTGGATPPAGTVQSPSSDPFGDDRR